MNVALSPADVMVAPWFCAELTPQNRGRELRGQLAAADLPGATGRKRELLVLTLNQRDALKEDGKTIAVLPAWDWLD